MDCEKVKKWEVAFSRRLATGYWEALLRSQTPNRKSRDISSFFLPLHLLVCFCVLIGCRESRPPTPEVMRLKPDRTVHDYRGYIKETPRMRVVLISRASSARIAVTGPYSIRAVSAGKAGGRTLHGGSKLSATQVSATKSGFRLGGREFRAGEIEIAPDRDGALRVSGRPYRGKLRVFRNPRRTITVVNVLDLESYLWGVLGSEMPLTWPDSALEAQSVAARTYSLYQKLGSKNRRYDVMATVASQAYKGMLNEKTRDGRSSTEFVNRTRGIVMRYGDDFIEAFYHNTCGGHTEDISRVFNAESIPPLSGLPCRFCRKSPYFTWRVELKATEIALKLRQDKRCSGISAISSITGVELGDSGRPAKIAVRHSSGTVNIEAAAFRRLVGYDKLRSTMFTARRSGAAFVFTGKGYGHGVGLCQYGAKGMAEAGEDYLTILAYYYPGIEFARIY